MCRQWKWSLAWSLAASAALAYGGCVGSGDESSPPNEGVSDDAGVDTSVEPADGSIVCGETVKDPKNCGRCGHDCLGGVCAQGKCQPVTIAKKEYRVSGLALGRSGIYFGSENQNHLLGCAFPCTTAKELYKSQGSIAGVAIDEEDDDKSVYFSDWGPNYYGAVRRCTLPDCAGGPVDVVIEIDSPRNVALAHTRLFWTNDYGQLGVAYRDRVNSAPIEFVPYQEGLTTFAASADRLYWLMYSGGGILRSCTLPDCAEGPKTLATGFGSPRQISLSGDRIYWGNATSILQCPMPDCAGGPTELVGKLDNVYGVGNDGKHLFWTVPQGVFECDLPGCEAPARIAPLFPEDPDGADAGDGGIVRGPGVLATDGRVIVWYERGEASVSFMVLP